MTNKNFHSRKETPGAVRIILYFCAFYFFMMGTALIFFPEFITRGLSGSAISPAITGMLRGAGGSIIPYSLLYIMIINKPYERNWALNIILTANIIAVCLDIISVLFSEYKISNAFIDLPVELISILGIVMIRFRIKSFSDKHPEL
jgi:hypothetical protein